MVVVILCLFFAGCSSLYYSNWEKLGKHKRDLLRDNVNAVRNEQMAAKEQFKDALTRFRELYAFDGGDLEKLYDNLNEAYEQCVDKADQVKSRIGKVETIASDLFDEWESEIDSMTNARLKASSRSKLRQTQIRYSALHRAMKSAEQRMDPILTEF